MWKGRVTEMEASSLRRNVCWVQQARNVAAGVGGMEKLDAPKKRVEVSEGAFSVGASELTCE